jgi:ERCC4-type nuclease
MVVVIDDRENPKVINKMLVAFGDRKYNPAGQAEVKRLKAADYILGDIGIEAKEINDLWQSILGIGRSRTIYAQLADLCEAFERPMLVVYGTKITVYQRPGAPRQNPRQVHARAHNVIKSFKQELYHRFPKIQFMQLNSMDEFVEYIAKVHHLQAIGQRLTVPNEVRKLSSKVDPRVACLAALPGLTTIHAEAILKKYGSIPKLLRAKTTQSSLMEIDGIGRKKAQTILSLRDLYE